MAQRIMGSVLTRSSRVPRSWGRVVVVGDHGEADIGGRGEGRKEEEGGGPLL